MIAEVPAVIKAYRKHNKGIPIEKLAHRYFDVLGEIQESKKKKDISALLGHCNMALCLLEPFIKYEKKESGQVPPVIPAIPEAIYFHAINGARGQLKNIQDIVEFFPELEHYQFTVKQGFVMLDVAARIRKHVGGNPGCHQNKLKKALEFDDGRLLSRVIHYMEVADQLERKKSGKTYELYVKEIKKISSAQPPKPSSPEKPTKETIEYHLERPEKKRRWWQRRDK